MFCEGEGCNLAHSGQVESLDREKAKQLNCKWSHANHQSSLRSDLDIHFRNINPGISNTDDIVKNRACNVLSWKDTLQRVLFLRTFHQIRPYSLDFVAMDFTNGFVCKNLVLGVMRSWGSVFSPLIKSYVFKMAQKQETVVWKNLNVRLWLVLKVLCFLRQCFGVWDLALAPVVWRK